MLGDVDLSEVVEGRSLEIPELSEAERAKLEAARVAEPCERLQALAEAFEAGLFDFAVQLLACSYSLYSRRPYHPLLLLKVWLAMLSVGSSSPGGFLRAVDDSLQLRLFLQVVFREEEFDVHETYAICPHGKQLNWKPNIFVRGSSLQWRYQAKKTDCEGCPLRAQCTKGKGAKMLCVNVYREDLEIHAARMKVDPDQARGLMGRHRAITEGIVNHLMNHQDVRYAHWKGLALARLEVGLAIVMLNTFKWYKIRHAQLKPVTLRTAA